MRSLRRNLENFRVHLLDELQLHFNVIGVTETRITNFNIPLDFDPSIPNYNFEYVPTPLSAGGVGMYIDNGLKYTVIEKKTVIKISRLCGSLFILLTKEILSVV